MERSEDLEAVVRSRLRELRLSQGFSLDELASRTALSPSTISRIETGKRTISLDVLRPLTKALHVSLDSLLATDDDLDVVIRPSESHLDGRTSWMLSRPGSPTVVLKMRFEPIDGETAQRVHPGHDWFFVMDGRVELRLGDRAVVVEAGEAADFDTMTPHAIVALDGPAELLMIFDRDGQRAHGHR